MPMGKRKVGGGYGRGRGSNMGKAPTPKVSNVSAKTSEAARRAAMRARVMKLARGQELSAGKSRPAPKEWPPPIPNVLKGNPAAKEQYNIAKGEARTRMGR